MEPGKGRSIRERAELEVPLPGGALVLSKGDFEKALSEAQHAASTSAAVHARREEVRPPEVPRVVDLPTRRAAAKAAGLANDVQSLGVLAKADTSDGGHSVSRAAVHRRRRRPGVRSRERSHRSRFVQDSGGRARRSCPTLVVEVTSNSTEDHDRSEKLNHYKQCPSVAAVLLVSHKSVSSSEVPSSPSTRSTRVSSSTTSTGLLENGLESRAQRCVPTTTWKGTKSEARAERREAGW